MLQVIVFMKMDPVFVNHVIDFLHGANVALKQLKGEIEMLLQYDESPNINPIMKRILNRRDLRTEFGTLFVNCELKDG